MNEVACLVDFGLDLETVLKGLEHLNELRAHYRPTPNVEAVHGATDMIEGAWAAQERP